MQRYRYTTQERFLSIKKENIPKEWKKKNLTFSGSLRSLGHNKGIEIRRRCLVDDVTPSNPNHSFDAPSRNSLRQRALGQPLGSGRHRGGKVSRPCGPFELLGPCGIQGALRLLLGLPQRERPGELYAPLREVGS